MTAADDTPRIRPFAVFVGWIADIGISLGFSIVLGVVGAALLIADRVPPGEMEQRLMEMSWLHGLGVLGSGCGSLGGGYIAAWIGRTRALAHGVAVGVVSLITGLVPILAFPDMQPLWVTVFAAVLTVPAAALGGYLRLGRQQITASKLAS